MEKFHIVRAKTVAELRKNSSHEFTMLLKHGSMTIEYFTPREIDLQTPHKQDEIYVIAAGKGTFFGGGDTVTFEKGDVIFVPAGMEHHFEQFSSDFATWVIFFGKEGGESGKGA
jgi:mannose-6-phosphate isomerase-like protein (cupin superfamily)